jgi:hypothetical protein
MEGMANLSPIRQVVACAFFACFAASPALAADPLVEGARLCTQQFPVQEQSKGIPMHLLAAISSTESGRWHDQLGLALPWPWTINAEGKGYYFNSKAEAIAKTSQLMRSGMRSIDVGCMQVNLKHHAGAFHNLDEAFDPATNVAYGAQFLRENYDDLGDWVKATAAYHSRTNHYGQEYLVRIEKSWNRIVAKVQQARARQGIQTAMAPGPDFDNTTLPPDTVSATARSVATNSKMRPLESTRNVRVIQVANRASPRSDVVVVRQPTAQSMVVKVADAEPVASPAQEMMVKTSGDSIRRVTIDNSGATSNNGGTNTSSSTRFVFAN